MRLPLPVAVQVGRFYDGGLDAHDGRPEVPPDRTAHPKIELERLTEAGVEIFAMHRRVAYDDREFGELLVPRHTATFRTDLTSVPWLFTWLVPKTGAHLPATLLHDGLVFAPGTEPTYTSTAGRTIHRADADRVLRAAMADTGTGLIRRWLVWSAVTAATMLSTAGTGWTPREKWHYRLAAGGTVLLIVLLGAAATLDLFDVSWAPELPWMGDRPFGAELVGGLAGAIVVPVVLGATWGRFFIAGWVIGIALAVLLPVTVTLLLLTGLYQLLEWVARRAPTVLLLLAVTVAFAALTVFVVLVV